jgi:hypothetical protein
MSALVVTCHPLTDDTSGPEGLLRESNDPFTSARFPPMVRKGQGAARRDGERMRHSSSEDEQAR